MKPKGDQIVTLSGRLGFRTALVVPGSRYEGLVRVRFKKRRGQGFVKHPLLVREEDILYKSPARKKDLAK